jgi:hypothetical protein
VDVRLRLVRKQQRPVGSRVAGRRSAQVLPQRALTR